MICVNANTSEEIALALRGQGGEFDKLFRAKEVADRLLGKKKEKSAILVTSPRQSGKTIELLRFAEEKYPNGQYAIVSPNQRMQEQILTTRYLLLEWKESIIPLMLTPDNIMSMRGQVKPILCDEWSMLPEKTQDIVIQSGLFVAAVTS